MLTDRFKKQVKAIPMKGMFEGEVTRVFIHDWVLKYDTQTELLFGSSLQFTSKFFQDVCHILNTSNAFTTTYNPQTEGQVERINRKMRSQKDRTSRITTMIGISTIPTSRTRATLNCKPRL